jgi:multidrug resistance efflux pump
MLVIAIIYILVIWLLFFRFRVIPWNWPWGIATVFLGVTILLVFVGLLNYLTPSGRIVVVSRVVEVTPNVPGQVNSIDVQPNALVKAGATLFQIERSPFEFKVRQLKAGLEEARQKAEQLKANLDLADADVRGGRAQLTLAEQRRNDVERLARTDAASQFRLQDATAQAELGAAQLQAAQARLLNAKLALGSEIEGENTSVAQLSAQLDNAKWELEQTTVRAPADGYVTAMALAAGARVLPARAALSFIVAADTMIVGIFPQNGFHTLRPGAAVKLVFADTPGRVFRSTIKESFRGIGQGQVAVSGVLARPESVGTSTDYPVQINIPEGVDRNALQLGKVGTATAFADNAGPIGILASILLWAKAYATYL